MRRGPLASVRLKGTRLDDQVLGLLRDQVAGIFIGAIFLFVGLAGCAIAAIRGRGGVRILVWFGIFNSMYGARLLAQTEPAFHVLPRSLWASRPYVIWIITYLILVPALLFWMELSLGRLRQILQITVILASLAAVAGIGLVVVTGHPDNFLLQQPAGHRVVSHRRNRQRHPQPGEEIPGGAKPRLCHRYDGPGHRGHLHQSKDLQPSLLELSRTHRVSPYLFSRWDT